MKKIEKLRIWLIHKLGGATQREMRITSDMNKLACMAIVLKFIKNYMNEIYGMPADEWCKNVYSFINECYNMAMGSINNTDKTTNGNENKESDVA